MHILHLNLPSDIRMDWETYNQDQNDDKLVDVMVVYGDAFPVKDADGNEMVDGVLQLSEGNIRTTWERSQTPDSEGSSASIKSVIVSLIPEKKKKSL